MKILILGATGMLGHRLFIELSKHHEVCGTIGGVIAPSWADSERIFTQQYAGHWKNMGLTLDAVKPDIAINCIAAIPQRSYDIHRMLNANADFPNFLSTACYERNIRLIHFSTDAVFSGKRGNYTEDDEPDGNDTYALTKRLGEITDQPHVLTLRCCPIGREIAHKRSLVEWFLAQKGSIQGYVVAWFTPLTTHEIARLLSEYVLPRPDLHGLYHAAGEPISKAVLLELIRDELQLDTAIIPDTSVDIDRTLLGKRLYEATGYLVPTWDKMIATMAADNALYEGEYAHG